MDSTASHLIALLAAHPKTPHDKVISYGTAGFRDRVDAGSDSVFLRAGCIAAVRAISLGRTIGVCVTASHNAVHDNGVKIMDPDGSMLDQSWEEFAAEVVNETNPRVLANTLFEKCETFSGAVQSVSIIAVAEYAPMVLTARDTRPSSAHLEGLTLAGAEAVLTWWQAKYSLDTPGPYAASLGVLTTPQLHFVVMRRNGYGFGGIASEAGYYHEMAGRFSELVVKSGYAPKEPLAVDCANGVGALKLARLIGALNNVSILPFNDDTEDFPSLNNKCGAEHVQKTLTPPKGYDDPVLRSKTNRFASYDGDADRIVFYFFEKDTLRLLDGDKIAVLFASFLAKRVPQAFENTAEFAKEVSIGCVQTAYANGSSSRYIKETLRIEAPLVKTGVKHLHHRAAEFDAGVYFEANGHGTVLFQPSFLHSLQGAKPTTPEGIRAKDEVLAFIHLLNQATGDALSDMLAVEGVLASLQMSFQDWYKMYADLPSYQSKVKVPDRALVVTNGDETQLVQPLALQHKIDECVAKFSQGRAFVRPSGTEDVVRVYAEAATPEDAKALGLSLEAAIKFFLCSEPETKRAKVA